MTNFVFRDHLGSVDVITNNTGTIVQEQSFDAWGQRRNATNWLALTASELINFNHSATTRGFTNHEMLDEVGIVHMNGRIYDARMGRFLQADPFVQSPTNSQSLNRYSYAWNNPLNNTDPSGYYNLLDGIFDAIKIVVAVVVGFGGDWGTAAAIIGTLSFMQSTANGASFGDALLAGISSAALTYLGGTLAPGGFDLGYTAQMATLGGITNVLQGGKFGHGFLSSGVGAASAGLKFAGTKAVQAVKRVTSAAVIGGTVSELTGGKFANGAAYAAFTSVLNAGIQKIAVSDYSTEGKLGPERFTEEQQESIRLEIGTAVSQAPEGGFDSETAAAKFLHEQLQPIAYEYDIEIAAHIFKDVRTLTYRTTQPVTGFYNDEVSLSMFRPRRGIAPFHTHQTLSDFSGNDFSFAERSTANGYLSNPHGLFVYRAESFRLSYNLALLRKEGTPSRLDFYGPVK